MNISYKWLIKIEGVFKMKNQKMKKINILYLLGYIFVPIIICALCFTIGIIYFPKGTMAVILFMVPTFLTVIWWCFAGKFIYKRKQKEFEKWLDDNKFERNQTFYGSGNMVVVDMIHGKIGLLFFWNPFQNYIVSAKKIEKAWVDDGKSGAGIFAGSGRVSFLFMIDGIKIRINTFTSNQRWRMDSEYILTGISKADMMVKVLEEAKSKGK